MTEQEYFSDHSCKFRSQKTSKSKVYFDYWKAGKDRNYINAAKRLGKRFKGGEAKEDTT